MACLGSQGRPPEQAWDPQAAPSRTRRLWAPGWAGSEVTLAFPFLLSTLVIGQRTPSPVLAQGSRESARGLRCLSEWKLGGAAQSGQLRPGFRCDPGQRPLSVK